MITVRIYNIMYNKIGIEISWVDAGYRVPLPEARASGPC